MQPLAPATTSARRSLAINGVVAAAALAIGLYVMLSGFPDEARSTPLSISAVVIAAVSLLGRHHFPEAVLAVTAIARLLVTTDAGSESALTPALAVALFTVAAGSPRRRNLTVALLVAGVIAVVTPALAAEPYVEELISEIPQTLLPIAVADAVRLQRDRLTDRVESESQLRVHAERLRIAHDLHDIVAHGLSSIAVQSGVAEHLLDGDVDRARTALASINTTSRASLDELRDLLGVLRSTELADAGAELNPVPESPADIDDLLATAASAGLDVTLDIDGSFPNNVQRATLVAFHRILSEALANVARHAGPVAVALNIEHGSDEVTVRVTNEPPVPGLAVVPSTGVGIAGMQERAASVGGTVIAKPQSAGRFTVSARLPYRSTPQAAVDGQR